VRTSSLLEEMTLPMEQADTARSRRAAREGDESKGGGPRRRRRLVRRRVRRQVKHVDPLSVVKLSLFFYGVFLVVWLALWAVVYWFLASRGFFDTIEHFGKVAALWENLDVSLWTVEKWALLAGVVIGIAGALLNGFLTVLYNVGSDLLGGAEVTFVEREP
jgi:hypothetical protein